MQEYLIIKYINLYEFLRVFVGKARSTIKLLVLELAFFKTVLANQVSAKT